MRLAIPSKVEPVAHASSPMHATLKKAILQCSPVSHAQARVTREQDSGADFEPTPHSVLPPDRAVEPPSLPYTNTPELPQGQRSPRCRPEMKEHTARPGQRTGR
jgi:hypothetical protein